MGRRRPILDFKIVPFTMEIIRRHIHLFITIPMQIMEDRLAAVDCLKILTFTIIIITGIEATVALVDLDF